MHAAYTHKIRCRGFDQFLEWITQVIKNYFPHNIHQVSIKKVKISMTYREITAIYSQNHANTLMFYVGKMQPFFKLRQVGTHNKH